MIDEQENLRVLRAVERAARNPEYTEEILESVGFERWAVTLVPDNEDVPRADYLTDPWTGKKLMVQWDEQIWVRQVKKGDGWKITHVLLLDAINCHWVLFRREADGDLGSW